MNKVEVDHSDRVRASGGVMHHVIILSIRKYTV